MKLEELKQLNSFQKQNFIKTEKGYIDWTFEQLVKYQGYGAAIKIVERYDILGENCKLIKSFKQLTQKGDCWLFEVEMRDETIKMLVDFDGLIIAGKYDGVVYRDFYKHNRNDILSQRYNKAFREESETTLND